MDRGVDAREARKLVDVPHAKGKVTFLAGPIKQNELVRYYSLADVVVDQFHCGAIGLTSLEAFSCSKPVIAYIYEDLYRKFYSELPPLINVKDEV